MNKTFNAVIKTALGTLFFLCFLEMPYGYYQIVRFAALVGFGLLTIDAVQRKRIIEAILFAFLVLLFQPFHKVALGKEIWNSIDVVVGIALLLSLFIKENQSSIEKTNSNSSMKAETKKY